MTNCLLSNRTKPFFNIDSQPCFPIKMLCEAGVKLEFKDYQNNINIYRRLQNKFLLTPCTHLVLDKLKDHTAVRLGRDNGCVTQ